LLPQSFDKEHVIYGLAGCGKSREFSRDVRCSGTPWMPGTRPGMTISLYFNGFVMAGLVPAIHAVAGIPLVACHGAFFRILLKLAY
jgi:hypothetical protein